MLVKYKMISTSKIEISRSALKHNIQFLRGHFGQDVLFSAVVKGNAYGHGIEQVVPIAEENGIKHFSVFSGDEALRVHKIIKPGTKLMVMGWITEENISWAIRNDVEFSLFNLQVAYTVAELARKIRKPARIHIELETGMYRTGFEPEKLRKLVALIKENPECFIVEGLCTHFAGAESIANHVRVKKQISEYNRKYKWLIKQGIHPKIRHTSCSASAINYPETRMDLMRIGILMYGYWPSPETKILYLSHKKEKVDPLKRILSWKTNVMTVKEVNAGKFIGYGTSFFAQENKKIAVIPVGYAQGYSRTLSNYGRILIKGLRAPVIGNVNMNMLIADVTRIPEKVERGDEVVLIGTQGQHTISVASFSDMSDMLNYETLSRLPDNIERVIID